MSVVTFPSIQDIAGLTPLNINGANTINTTGVQNITLYTVHSNGILHISNCIFWITQGALTYMNITTTDHTPTTSYLMAMYAPAVNYVFQPTGDAWVDSGGVVTLGLSISTQPLSYHASIIGEVYRRGEGVLD